MGGGIFNALATVGGMAAGNISQERQATFENQLRAKQMELEHLQSQVNLMNSQMEGKRFDFERDRELRNQQMQAQQWQADSTAYATMGQHEHDPNKRVGWDALAALASKGGDPQAQQAIMKSTGITDDEMTAALKAARAYNLTTQGLLNTTQGNVLGQLTGNQPPTAPAPPTLPSAAPAVGAAAPPTGGPAGGVIGGATLMPGRVNNPALFNSVRPLSDGLYAIGPHGEVYKLPATGGTP